MSLDIDFQLTSPITYQSKGENVEARIIVLNAPSNKQRRAASRLKQLFFRALASFEGKEQGKEAAEQKPKGSDIVTLLMMSKDVEIEDAHEAFKDLVTTGSGSLDGEVSMNEHHYDAMSFEDSEAMLGEYLVAFLIPSS